MTARGFVFLAPPSFVELGSDVYTITILRAIGLDCQLQQEHKLSLEALEQILTQALRRVSRAVPASLWA